MIITPLKLHRINSARALAPTVADHAEDAHVYCITACALGGEPEHVYFRCKQAAIRFWRACVDDHRLEAWHWRDCLGQIDRFNYRLEAYIYWAFTVVDVLTSSPGSTLNFTFPLSFARDNNQVLCNAGGGGGCGSFVSGCVSGTGSGGGGAGFAIVANITATPGSTTQYVSGVGGAAGTVNSGNGGTGGSSAFGTSNYVAASGGIGGIFGINQAGGAGGAGTVGTVKTTGGSGGSGPAAFVAGGGGGGAAGPNGNGGNGGQGTSGAGDAGKGGAAVGQNVAGNPGTEYNGSVGAGSGGGGGFGGGGFPGGLYGGGGGGGYVGQNGGVGVQGLNMVFFTPFVLIQGIIVQ